MGRVEAQRTTSAFDSVVEESFVIAFAGPTKSGKTVISQAVATELGCGRASFGDVTRIEASLRGLPSPTREDLQAIGEDLVQHHCQEFCKWVLRQASWQPGLPAVVEGVRHVKVLESLRGVVDPQRMLLIVLEASEAERVSRMGPHETTTLERLRALDAHSTEAEVHHQLPEIADFRVGGKTMDETIAAILRWIRSRME